MSHFRSDRIVQVRKLREDKEQALLNFNSKEDLLRSQALWENRDRQLARSRQVSAALAQLRRDRQLRLYERRAALSALLRAEEAELDRALQATAETPAQQLERLTRRAMELKAKRETERQKIASEKLYQQWRENIDELRQADSTLFELQVTQARDAQLDEKRARLEGEWRDNQVFEALIQERYRLETEKERQKSARQAASAGAVKSAIDAQVNLKRRISAQAAAEAAEEARLAQTELNRCLEEENVLKKEEQTRIVSERIKMAAWLADARERKSLEKQAAVAEDRDYVNSVLLKERQLADLEEGERKKYIQQVREFNEALKADLVRQAASDDVLAQAQIQAQEREWQKRFDQWEAEESARRALMRQVYDERGQQVLTNEAGRDRQRQAEEAERLAYLADQEKQLKADEEKRISEELKRKLHQEDLFRQMDYRQVQKQRELNQEAIEQRQAMMAEEKFQRAIAAEKAKQREIAESIFRKRKEQRPAPHVLQAPWDK